MKRRRSSLPPWASYWPRTCPAYGSARYESLPWPEKVPTLTEEDVSRRAGYPPLRDRPPFDLVVWYERTFERADQTGRGCSTVAAVAYMLLSALASRRTAGACSSVSEYADLKQTSKQDLADLWNEAMRHLGYDTSAPPTEEPDEYAQFFS